MRKPTTITQESVSEYREFIELRLRRRVLEAIEVVLEEELDQALGCGAYERSERRLGYRNGAETRRITTAVGNARASSCRELGFGTRRAERRRSSTASCCRDTSGAPVRWTR